MIRFENVFFSFDGKPVLSGLSFEIEEGETVCLMGASGAGKTTCVRLLLGLLKPDAGKITGLPGCASAVFQEDRLCESFNAVENILAVAPRGALRGDALMHLGALGLGEKESAQRVSTLSGGQRRRVALVRAVMREAPLLILDEAFKGLDEKARAAAVRYIKKEAAGRTVVAVTHDKEEARFLGARVIAPF